MAEKSAVGAFYKGVSDIVSLKTQFKRKEGEGGFIRDLAFFIMQKLKNQSFARVSIT